MSLKKYLTEAELAAVQPVTGDEFDISIRDLTNIETFVLEHSEGSITIALDEKAIKMLEGCGCTFEEDEDENEEEQVDELAPLIGAIGRAALPLAGRALGSLGGAALSGAGSLAGGALAGTGAAIGGAVKGAKNIAKGFDDEEDEDNFEPGSVGKQLALADKHSEEEKIDELAPLKALAGLGAKVAKANTTKAAGQVVKSVGKTLDKKLFGPKSNEGDYEYEEGLNDIRRLSGMKIDELSNKAKQEYVKRVTDKGGWFAGPSPNSLAGMEKDMGTVSDYAKKDPSKTTLSADWDKIHKNLKSKYDRRALNVNKVQGQLAKAQVGESEYDTSPNSPYDRGAADAYYGRAARPHKIVPYTGTDGVKGQMQKVSLTDPAEIAAYEAGYSEAEFGEKDYGESVMPEGRFEEPMSGWRIVNKKNDSVVKGKEFKSKEDAQKYLMTNMFANHQDYKVVQFDESINEAEYQGRKVQLGKPMQGDVKKFKVYVKDPKTGNVKKVNFGDPNMRIKKSNPARRKSFRARHNCDNPGPRTKARYWSCRKW